jgi:hypothetical protein
VGKADAEDTMRTPNSSGRRYDIVEYEALTDDDSWHDVKVLIRESARCLVTYEVEEAASGTSEQKYYVCAIQLPTNHARITTEKQVLAAAEGSTSTRRRREREAAWKSRQENRKRVRSGRLEVYKKFGGKVRSGFTVDA